MTAPSSQEVLAVLNKADDAEENNNATEVNPDENSLKVTEVESEDDMITDYETGEDMTEQVPEVQQSEEKPEANEDQGPLTIPSEEQSQPKDTEKPLHNEDNNSNNKAISDEVLVEEQKQEIEQIPNTPTHEQSNFEPVTAPVFSTEEKPAVKAIENNFWLDGNYKKVVHRIEDGSKLLDDLAKMVHERAEIENLYANKLKAWQRKWSESSNKSFEYGSIYDSMLGGLQEGVALADLHLSVYSRLEELNKNMQQWRSDTYPKAITMKIKESKRSDDAFIKAQKPWVIKYNEANKCMKAYHSANRLLAIANTQVVEAKNSSIPTPQEQLNKLQNKVKKAEQDIITTKDKYQEALRDVGNYNPKYQDDMKYEFEKCQKFEETRRNYVKEKLLQFHACTDRNLFTENYSKIYSEMGMHYNAIKTPMDLQWYQESYGFDHPFITLSYIEYDPNLHGQEATNSSAAPNAALSPSSKTKKKSGVCTTL